MSGKTKRICFDPLSMRGSIYTTDREEIQTALENHPYFGNKFKLYSTVNIDEKKEDNDVTSVIAGAVSGNRNEVSAQGGKKSNVVQVSGLADATSYLIEQYNISRTRLRTVEQIKKAAAEVGIKFEGI